MGHIKTSVAGAALAAALCAIAPGASALTIDTASSWNGSSAIGTFGNNGTSVYGQTIHTDSTGGALNSFTFYLTQLAPSFMAQVYQWDAALGRATGAALFSSSPLSVAGSGPGFHDVQVNTGGLALNGNTDYVLLFTTSGNAPGQPLGANTFGFIANPNTYAGGAFVFFNNAGGLGAINSQKWDNFLGNYGDLAFKADITPVTPIPEPSTYALMALGLLATAAAVRRNRRSA